MGQELVYPITGEVVSWDDAAGCIRLLSEIRTLEQKLKELKGELTLALEQEFSRQGTKTLELDGVKAVLGANSQIVWDIEILQELQEAGLPEARFDALVTTEITYRVNANEAKRIASANASYANIIERAQSRIPKTPYVSIKS